MNAESLREHIGKLRGAKLLFMHLKWARPYMRWDHKILYSACFMFINLSLWFHIKFLKIITGDKA